MTSFEFSETPTMFERHAPHLGADGREVLEEAGLSVAEIEGLIETGGLRLPAARGT